MTLGLAIIALIFILIPILYLVLPKKEISEAERRKLQPFPKLTAKNLFDGTFNRELETFLSDHMPGRNALIKTDQGTKRVLSLSFSDKADEDKVELVQGKREVFDEGNVMQRPDDAPPAAKPADDAAAKAPEPPAEAEKEPTTTAKQGAWEDTQAARPKGENEDEATAFESYNLLITDGRAMEIFNYAPESWSLYAKRLNHLRSILPADVKLTSMLVPTAVAFYGPSAYRDGAYSHWDAFRQAYGEMSDDIVKVDTYGHLEPHVSEYIYFKTDHHWNGRGAYYGYEAYCAAHGMTPTPLDSFYVQKSEPFLGTLYAYSEQSPILEKNPDIAEYYLPQHVGFPTFYESADMEQGWEGMMLQPNNDYPYLGYSGGDVAVNHIQTKLPETRKLCVIKDSYGNALVPYFMDHYTDIYVLDPRQFDGKLLPFLEKHGIKEVLVVNYSFACSNPSWQGGFEYMIDFPEN